MAHSIVLLVLALIALVGVGCTSAPAGPRPTLPHPSYAPVVVPTPVRATPRPTAAIRPAAPDPTPVALRRDPRWEGRLCASQFELVSIMAPAYRMMRALNDRDLKVASASAGQLADRSARVARTLRGIPPRYARSLLDAEIELLDQIRASSLHIRTVVRKPTVDNARRLMASGRALQRAETVARTQMTSWTGTLRVLCGSSLDTTSPPADLPQS